MDHKDYWVETVMSSFEEHGICADAEQIERVAGDMQGSSENEGMAFGDDVAHQNLAGEHERELARLRKKLEAENERETARLDKVIDDRGRTNSRLRWRIQELNEKLKEYVAADVYRGVDGQPLKGIQCQTKRRK